MMEVALVNDGPVSFVEAVFFSHLRVSVLTTGDTS